MLIYSMLKRENKTYDLTNYTNLQLTFLHLKNCRILYNENLTSNKKRFGYQAFNDYSADDFF